jgi:hypothetical protein
MDDAHHKAIRSTVQNKISAAGQGNDSLRHPELDLTHRSLGLLTTIRLLAGAFQFAHRNLDLPAVPALVH